MAKEPRQIKIVGFTPFQHQRAVIQLVDEHPTGARIIVKSSRQKGKSILLNQLLIRNAVNKPKTNSVLIEPTNAGCRRMLQDAIDCLSNIPIVKSANQQFNEITFTNGSSILYRSAESEDGLRGISLKKNSLLCLDEGAFLKDEVYSIVLPFANVHDCTVLVCSTPKFKTGMYYQLYSKAKEGKKGFYLVDFGDYDTSMLISQEQLDLARETMPYQAFVNEYMGEFMELRGEAFGDFSGVLNDNFNKTVDVYYMAIDWGAGTNNDSTAISIFNNMKEQVFVEHFNNETAPATIARIIKRIKEYNPVSVTVEQNSIGQVQYDNLVDSLRKEKIAVRVKKFVTTNDSKRRIIEKMISAIEHGEITLLNDTEQSLQLTMYKKESTRTGLVTYNAPSGYHDDIVIADAICLDELIIRNAKYNIR